MLSVTKFIIYMLTSPIPEAQAVNWNPNELNNNKQFFCIAQNSSLVHEDEG